MIGVYGIAEKPLAVFDLFDLSKASPFFAILQNPENELIYLAEIEAYSDTLLNNFFMSSPLGATGICAFDWSILGGVTIKRYSDYGYFTKGSDSVQHASYLPLAINPYQFEVSILSGNDFRGGIPSFGAIRLLNGDSEIDDLADLYMDGRSVAIKAGLPSWEYADFEKVFDGIIQSAEFNENEVILNISDKSDILETEFSQNVYLGTGGLEGGAEVQGRVKPLAYGNVKNCEPVLVDSANLIYQVHDGSIEAVTGVFDKGVALTAEGNVTDITAASVSAGHFKTQLSGGYIKLGSSPAGRITADIEGDNTGGYISGAGNIIRRLAKTKLGFKNFTDDTIDAGAMNLIDTTITGDSGIFISGKTDLKNVFDALLTPIHCYWTFDRSGILTAGVLDAPSNSPVLTITDDNIAEDSFRIQRVIPAAWRISLGYGRSWTVQSKDDMASGAALSRKEFASEGYRLVISEDRAVRSKNSGAITKEFYCLLESEADALLEIERLRRIYGVRRKVIRISIPAFLFRAFVGDVIKLQTAKFSINDNFIVTGIFEDAETNLVELELWG